MYCVIECSYWATVCGRVGRVLTVESGGSSETIWDERRSGLERTHDRTSRQGRVFARVHFFVYVSDVVGGRNVVFVSETARMYVVQRFS